MEKIIKTYGELEIVIKKLQTTSVVEYIGHNNEVYKLIVSAPSVLEKSQKYMFIIVGNNYRLEKKTKNKGLLYKLIRSILQETGFKSKEDIVSVFDNKSTEDFSNNFDGDLEKTEQTFPKKEIIDDTIFDKYTPDEILGSYKMRTYTKEKYGSIVAFKKEHKYEITNSGRDEVINFFNDNKINLLDSNGFLKTQLEIISLGESYKRWLYKVQRHFPNRLDFYNSVSIKGKERGSWSRNKKG